MKIIRFTVAVAVLVVSITMPGISQDMSPSDEFWSSLKKLCGKAYAGSTVTAPESDTTLKGKKLVMDVYSCQSRKIKITFIVGNDRSRTWVFYQSGDRLLLKHEHRLSNGTPDDVTNYGGWTTNQGTATRQVFPADEETSLIIPDAATNVWWVELMPGKSFIYNMQRLGTERLYSLNFDLSKEIPVPELLEN